MKHAVSALVLGLVVLVAVFTGGATASQPGYLAASSAQVPRCDSDGFTIDGFTLNGAQQVTAVTVGGINPACFGGELTLHLTDEDNASIGASDAEEITASPMTVAIAGDQPNNADVKHEVLIVVGPVVEP